MKEPFPRCFDSKEQYVLWVAAARSSHPTAGHSYCEDCTPAYQARMISSYRCQFPGTTFHIAADEGIHGRRSFKEIKALRDNA